MSARYRLKEFKDAGIEPQDCDRLITDRRGILVYMACDYHEGYIDGFNTAKALP